MITVVLILTKGLMDFYLHDEFNLVVRVNLETLKMVDIIKLNVLNQKKVLLIILVTTLGRN